MDIPSGINKNPWFYLPKSEEDDKTLDLSPVPTNLQMKILKKFPDYKELAEMEATCKYIAKLVNDVGYIFQAARVAIDEETEYIIASGQEHERIEPFTEKNTRIIAEELDISYTDPLLMMEETRLNEAIQMIEANGIRADRLVINIPFPSKALFERLLMAVEPKKLALWAEISSEFLKTPYIYESIKQLVIPKEMEVVEEEILKFRAKELTVMNGILTMPGLLRITREFILSRREVTFIQIHLKENDITVDSFVQGLQEEYPVDGEDNRVQITRLCDGHRLQLVFTPNCITFSDLNTYW